MGGRPDRKIRAACLHIQPLTEIGCTDTHAPEGDNRLDLIQGNVQAEFHDA